MSKILMKISNIIYSVDFWKVAVPVFLAIIAWSLNERSELRWEQYKQKEESYRKLLESIRGFYASTRNADLRRDFLDELNMCWLYAPDDVINKGYRCLSTVHKGSGKSDKEQELAFGDFIVAIRQDLLSGNIVNKTHLQAEDFKHLKPIGP